MPISGHTSGLRLFGSDETDADQCQRWRRMRARLGIVDCESLSAGFRARGNNGQRDECRVYLVARISFRQRVRWSRFMFARSRATGLVSTGTRLARLLSWRTREDT